MDNGAGALDHGNVYACRRCGEVIVADRVRDMYVPPTLGESLVLPLEITYACSCVGGEELADLYRYSPHAMERLTGSYEPPIVAMTPEDETALLRFAERLTDVSSPADLPWAAK
jgi:hypothetical protein